MKNEEESEYRCAVNLKIFCCECAQGGTLITLRLVELPSERMNLKEKKKQKQFVGPATADGRERKTTNHEGRHSV